MDRGDASSAQSSEVTFEWGQQAGLFWYVDDNNYLKLVLEGMKDGGCAVVLAGEKNAVPAVIAKVPVAAKEILLPGAAFDEPVPFVLLTLLFMPLSKIGVGMRLRLEVNADGCVTGMFQARGSPCMRLVGRADAYQELAVSSEKVQVGIGAHGGSSSMTTVSESGLRYALFYNFRGVWTPQDRIQMGKDPDNISLRSAMPLQTTSNATVEPVTNVLSGWTLSPDLSEEDKNNIAALLGGASAYSPSS